MGRKIEEVRGTVAQVHLRIVQAHLWPAVRPDREIVKLAEEIDAGLIAMGRVSDSVVRHADCPVLVVRAEKGSRPLEGSFSATPSLTTKGRSSRILLG